jgi:TolB-like protein/tetratricopeptide (TPR) repeat protein
LRYSFDGFQLDTDQYKLHRNGEPVHVEPLVFDLLRLFVENAGTLIDRERMTAEVWGGRVVSDATLSTAIKSARRILGDSGTAQALIETVRSRGFRFTGTVVADAPPPATVSSDAARAEVNGSVEKGAAGAPSVAILPFTRLGDPELYGGFEEAIPHEVIFGLSRLRSLSVIARGSSFRFRGPDVDLVEVGRRLGVRYCLTGMLEVLPGRLCANVELVETWSGRVIWGERFAGSVDDVHLVRSEIVGGIVSTLESQIGLHEALLAQAKAPDSLDAWQAFHLGVKRMHDYTRAGNEAAEALFRRAVSLAPGFARAHAGLSFTHFQKAFMRYVPDRQAEIEAARRTAEKGLELDPLDPFANLTMGRSLWLGRDLDSALPWLERAVGISPNYAQAVYSRGLIDAIAGRTESGLVNADRAMQLSPLDPLLYAMRAAKALAHVTGGSYAEAARWADAAARTPRAHIIIFMIAAATHAIGGDPERARYWSDAARDRDPTANQTLFFEGLPVHDPTTRRLLSRALTELGF